jgi:hypothetical protein
MRHFLRQEPGHPLPLPVRVLTCSLEHALVLGARAPHRLAPSMGAALARAVDLAVVARGADAHLPHAAPAPEKPTFRLDHRPPAGDVSGHGHGVERWSTAERRVDHRDDPEGSGRLPRAFALSAVPPGYPITPARPGNRPSTRAPTTACSSAPATAQGSGLRPDLVAPLCNGPAAAAFTTVTKSISTSI